jgi:hypothetical protein
MSGIHRKYLAKHLNSFVVGSLLLKAQAKIEIYPEIVWAYPQSGI